jgi:hypothetical protein
MEEDGPFLSILKVNFFFGNFMLFRDEQSGEAKLISSFLGQANRYIRSMAKEMAVNGLEVMKLSDKNLIRKLENAVQFGQWVLLENILESLDATLEPVLLQQKFKQVCYSSNRRFY